MKTIIVHIPDEAINNYGMAQIYSIFNNLWFDYDMKYETLDDGYEYAAIDKKKRIKINNATDSDRRGVKANT